MRSRTITVSLKGMHGIAERSCFLSTREKPEIPLDFPKMVEKTRTMLRKSLDALVNRDAKLAREVLVAEDVIYMTESEIVRPGAEDYCTQ